jgi:excisionase family DNA binding protein
LLTVKEVADLLRVKERKVYDMAAAGEIPHRRLTGRLLFPEPEISAWIAGDGGRGTDRRPDVFTGSHDPLLDWAMRESGSGLAALIDGSSDGLERFAAGEAALCGLHVPEDGGWKLETVQARGLKEVVLTSWAKRQQGLILAKGISVTDGLKVLCGRRVALRQPGAGGRVLFDRLLAEAGFAPTDLEIAETVARTESEIAANIASGEAEVALGLECMARQFGLGFVPLVQEQFDLLADRRAWFTEPVQKLIRFTRTSAFIGKAETLGGYDVSTLGQVRWLSR